MFEISNLSNPANAADIKDFITNFFPDYALEIGWSMNWKQGARYIKKTIGNDLKKEILTHQGIPIDELACTKSRQCQNT